MAENPKFIQLLTEVRDATEEGSLQWEADGSERYSAWLGSGATLSVGRTVGYFPLSYYAILEDSSGKELERLWQSDTDDPQESPADPFYRALRELYELSRRKALKVDDLLDGLIESVKAKKQATGNV